MTGPVFFYSSVIFMKNSETICCIDRLSSSEYKTSAVILALFGHRFLLKLIEWSPSARHHEALYKVICAPHPKSFCSISPLHFILYNPPRTVRGGKSDRRSPNCWGRWTACLMVWPMCVWLRGRGRGRHIFLQPPHLSSTAGLCNGGGHGVTICQEVCVDSRGLCSSHYQCLDIPLLIIIQVYSKPGGA